MAIVPHDAMSATLDDFDVAASGPDAIEDPAAIEREAAGAVRSEPASVRRPGALRPGPAGRAAPRPTRAGNRVPPPQVAAMFDEIAPVYDRVNSVMTLGADRSWRESAVRATGVGDGASAIDVACGTGKLTAALAERVGPFGRVLGVDLSTAMIELATRTNRDLVQLQFVVGNALGLPVPDGDFDTATIAFGLRNLADYEAGFRELRRVVRPGGTVVCLELSIPRPRAWAVVYHGLFRRAAPLLGGLFRHRAAYAYLPDSLDGFPAPRELALTMQQAGLVDVTWRRLALGTVAIHRGRVPAA